jgi:adenosylcobinamide-GDP ribazoletransferase
MDFWLPVTGLFPTAILLTAFACFSVFGIAGIPGADPFAAAVITLTAQYLCFNLFHLDGLMDTADAFLGTADRDKRLSILKDSRIGVYGFFAGFAALSLKTAFLRILFAINGPLRSGLPPDKFPLAVCFAFPLFGRFSAALVPCFTKPASPGGLGGITKDARPVRCAAGIIAALACFGLCVVGWTALRNIFTLPGRLAVSGGPWGFYPSAVLSTFVYAGICLVLISPLTAWFYARLYRKSLGGYTGDALGAAIETAEILCLVVGTVIGTV